MEVDVDDVCDVDEVNLDDVGDGKEVGDVVWMKLKLSLAAALGEKNLCRNFRLFGKIQAKNSFVTKLNS